MMRDAKGMETMDGVQYLASCPDGETIVAMVVHHYKLYIATEKHIYRLDDERRLTRIGTTQTTVA
jgi:hypothetical protein